MAEKIISALAGNEDEAMIQASAQEFLAAHEPLKEARALRDSDEPSGCSAKLWEGACELGWPGLLVPEAHDGVGLGFREVGVIFEALGRELAPTPLFSSGVLCASALSLVGAEPGLSEIAGGQTRMSLALEESPHFAPLRIETRAQQSGAGFRLNGAKCSVLDGAAANAWLVVARIGDGEELGLFRVPRERFTEGSTQRWIDGRRAMKTSFRDLEVPSAALVGRGDAAGLIEPLVDRAAAILAAELVGVSAAAFEMTLDYLKARKQFEEPIASFQALQHRCARLFTDLERGVSLVRDSLRALDEDDPEASKAASAAKAHMSRVARELTADALQLYGGLGMTEEQDIGLFYKRARVASTNWGDTPFHHNRFARLSGF